MIPISLKILFAGLLGVIIGSFLNVVIYRGPVIWGLIDDDSRGNLAVPRSKCPSCGHPIKSHHLIPILGYLLVRGNCAHCHAAISLRYPMVELLGGLVCALTVAIVTPFPNAILASVFLWGLIALAFIDSETGFLPDALTIPLALMGLVVNAFGIFIPFTDAIIGAVIGYLTFKTISWVFLKLRGIDGLGGGDAKLLAALGGWTGWAALPMIVLAASVVTLMAIGLLKLTGREISNTTPIPFGPALAAAGAITFLVQPFVIAH